MKFAGKNAFVHELCSDCSKGWNPTAWLVHPDKLEAGENVWVGAWCLLDASGGLKIGSNVVLASGSHVYTHDSWERDIGIAAGVKRSPTQIGSHVFIGAHAVILKGSIVEDRVVIGANAVVQAGKHLPANTIWAGTPAKQIKKIAESGE